MNVLAVSQRAQLPLTTINVPVVKGDATLLQLVLTDAQEGVPFGAILIDLEGLEYERAD